MLFDDEEVSGRRLSFGRRNIRGHENFTVETRLRSQRTGRMYRIGSVVLVIIVGAGVLFGLWRTLTWLEDIFFSKNKHFTVSNLDIRSDGDVITPRHVMEYTGLRPGMNMFYFDIRNIRRDLIRAVPNIKAIDICRRLPNTIEVHVKERMPIARMGRQGYLTVDNEGRVFGLRANRRNLPVITGYSNPTLKPGDKVEGLGRDAVVVLDMCERTAISREMVINAIDVRGGFAGMDNALRLYLAGDTTVDLWWHKQVHDKLLPADDLQNRLFFLRTVIKKAQKEKRRLETVNLTLENYTNNCPITPRWN